ncbi:hypothetical protein GCM10009812_20420 [Nocardioides marinus]|uniref:Recombinase domain-containing protein n=1 Tax=Nocardioides marinus TaxID=374514 RepID=A0A7Z0C474_9ACTN|nr:recombinase family protein [Nocardioides marinus]NYI11017.1 hypothetical protein [Nocardioides marinus]
MLMHGIMSSIAEFYSRNLANKVTKGLVQKASLGGTVTRAPLGYKNVHVTDDLGRINRTVEIDTERSTHITWAFYRYAEGDCSLSILLDQLTDRGLITRATPKWPSKPLSITALHKVLKNPYYKGEIHYRGVIYPGAHEPLVDPQTWQQVQDPAGPRPAGRQQQRCGLPATEPALPARQPLLRRLWLPADGHLCQEPLGHHLYLPDVLRTQAQDHALPAAGHAGRGRRGAY